MANFLAGNLVFMVRHAEKPTTGPGLSAVGQARAERFATYFRPLQQDGFSIEINALYAGADSGHSMRPRLTLEPLSCATDLPLDASIGTDHPKHLVKKLQETPHGNHPLICWRHKEMPTLITALGGNAGELLPDSHWPIDEYNWLMLLCFDENGARIKQQCLQITL